MTGTTDDVLRRLAAPFEADQVKFKPQVVKGNRAMAICYIDARLVMDRLDEVVGVDGWQDEYEELEGNNVACRLRVKIGGEWITKMDVGGPSDQPDEGDRTKAAFSDALKRAAIKFGIGRYLYRIPQIWADYDPQKKQFVRVPALPRFALPSGNGVAPAQSGTMFDQDMKKIVASSDVETLRSRLQWVAGHRGYRDDLMQQLNEAADRRCAELGRTSTPEV